MKAQTNQVTTGQELLRRRYQNVIVGSPSLIRVLYYEFCMWLAPVPGALGLMLRKLFWPRLLGSCGPNVQFGRGIVLRHPHRIHLGAQVLLSEGCILDARNEATDRTIVLGDNIIIAPYAILQAKAGLIHVGSRCGIGAQSIILAGSGNDVTIGDDVACGPRCTILGSGHYSTERLDVPIIQQEVKTGCSVVLEHDIWLGGGSLVVGSVRIGHGSFIGPGAVVTDDIAPLMICAGVPAQLVKRRGDHS